MKERDHLEDLDVDVMIRLEWILKEIRCKDVDRVHLTQNRN
jgi:hypothetical protein